MKKKRYYGWLAALCLSGIVMGSCNDDNGIEINNPARPGDAIQFSVAEIKTRTVYEDRLQINWVENDQIGIYSNDVAYSEGGDTKHAAYKITEINVDDHLYHGNFAPTESAKFLKWGENLETACTFYGAYPAERIVAYPDEGDNQGKFSMRYRTNQTCTVNKSSANGQYLTDPDMKNAYMMAKNEVAPIGDHVLLAFDPIMTTLDITVTAGQYEVGTGIIQPMTITGVSVIMPKKLNSETLDYKINDLTNESLETTPRGELTNAIKENTSESIFVNIQNGDKKYIDLYEDESINLMAFLPPMSGLTGVKIRVHTVGAFDFVVTVDKELMRQSKIDVTLPDVSPETTKPNNWISKLDKKTPLKKMSIPAYVLPKGTETSKVEELLKKGVRAFDAEVFASSNTLNKNIDENFVETCNRFVEENTGEFMIVWVERSGINITQRPDKWIDFPSCIEDAVGRVILLDKYKYNSSFINVGDGILKRLFSFGDITTINLSNTDWAAQFIKGSDYNKSIYNSIVSSDSQTACTGIVTIPNAGEQFDKTYGDLLLQAIIDCNFKSRTDFQ